MVDVLEIEAVNHPARAEVINTWLASTKDTPSGLSNRHEFTTNRPFDVYVAYSNSQTNQIVKTLFQSGDVAFQDESPIQHGKGSKIVKDDLENILKGSARAMGLNFAFINPSFFPVETVHYYIRILGYVRNKGLTVATLMTHDEGVTDYIGCAEFEMHDIPGLRDYYKKMSLEMKKKLKESGGHSSYKPDKKEKDRLIRLLVDAVNDAMEDEGVDKATLGYVSACAQDIDKIRDSIDCNDIISKAYRRIISGGNSDDDDGEADDGPARTAPEKAAPPVKPAARAFTSPDEVIAAEIARIIQTSVVTSVMSNEDSMRLKYLRQGLNLTFEEVLDLETNAISLATATDISTKRNMALTQPAPAATTPPVIPPTVTPASPPTADFVVTRGMIAEIVNEKRAKLKEPAQADYYMDCLDAPNQTDVAVKYNVTASAISQAWTKLNTPVQQQIGRKYEAWYADWLDRHKVELGIENVFHDGASGKSDIIVKYLDQSIDVISVKWRNPHQAKPYFTINVGDLEPEIIKTRQFIENDKKKARLVLHIRIRNHVKKVEEYINVQAPRNSYNYSIKDFEEATA